MNTPSDVDFATLCALRDFTDEELAYIERAARATNAFVAWRRGKREHMSERFTGETASQVLEPWDDEPALSVRIHSAAISLANETRSHKTRGGVRDPKRPVQGYGVSYTSAGTYRVQLNNPRESVGTFPTENQAHKAGRKAVEELKAS